MKTSRRRFLKATAYLTAVGCLAVAGGIGSYEDGVHLETQWLTVEQVPVPLKNLNSALEGLKIVQLSDFHLHPYTQIELIQQAVQITNALQPDLAVLTGDYVLASADSIFELAPVLAALDARYGVFTILGNHDLWTNAGVVRAGLEANGLPVLHNEGVTLNIGRAQLHLAGVDDGWSGQPDLNAALDTRPSDIPAIPLAHEPD